MLRFELFGEPVAALPDRSVWHARSRTLFVADLHLGKASAFRAGGIPVPETTAHTLARLGDCVRQTGAERLVILGDLLHAPTGRTPSVMDATRDWRGRHGQIDIALVRGNHDVRSGDPPADWGMALLDSPANLSDTPFLLAHAPEELTAAPGAGDDASSSSGLAPVPGHARYGLCGHLHPSHPLPGMGAGRAPGRRNAPCLWITPSHAVLPAFGDFTGGRRIAPGRHDRAILFIDGEVFEAPRFPVQR